MNVASATTSPSPKAIADPAIASSNADSVNVVDIPDDSEQSNDGIHSTESDNATSIELVLSECVDMYKVHQDWYEFDIQPMDEEALAVESIRQLDNSQFDDCYSLSGRKLSQIQRGINIVRMKDGTTKKVLIK